ncbi:MAG: hypothetical protein FH762_18285 [Firmicutes bacterium]|nr:hypothetical protein [Bacillota bacterium]
MKKITTIIGIAFIYVGAVVGAGFSSGQEIWKFFACHRIHGLYGIGLAGVFFTGLVPRFFVLGKKIGAKSYQDFFYGFLPPLIAVVFDIIYSCFLVGSVSVMMAGGGTVFKDFLGLSYYFGLFISITFVYLTLYLKTEGIFTVNNILIPGLTIITILTITSFFRTQKIDIFDGFLPLKIKGWQPIIDGLIYGAYNTVMAVAVMTGLVAKKDDKLIILGGITGGGILFFLCIILFAALLTAFKTVPQEEIPMFFIAGRVSNKMYLAYIVALYFAMISTGIANLYAFNRRITSLLSISYETGLFITLFIIVPFAWSGFGNLVGRLYPIFGYLSLFIILYYIILLFKIKNIKKI